MTSARHLYALPGIAIAGTEGHALNSAGNGTDSAVCCARHWFVRFTVEITNNDGWQPCRRYNLFQLIPETHGEFFLAAPNQSEDCRQFSSSLLLTKQSRSYVRNPLKAIAELALVALGKEPRTLPISVFVFGLARILIGTMESRKEVRQLDCPR